MYSAMVGVGNSYTDGPDADSDCKLQACYFLKVCGGFLLALDLFNILVICILAMWGSDKPGGEICGGVKMIGQFVIYIWGSVLIFGPYQN